MEGIFVRLYAFHRGSKMKDRSRCNMVIRAYKQIRECIVSNARLMTETTIQLGEVNSTTVHKW